MLHYEPIRVGYVVKMFPRLSETFILNEILELERQGVDVHIFSLRRPTDHAVHAQIHQVRARLTYLPERIWLESVRAIRALSHVGRRYPRLFGQVFRHGAPRRWRKVLLRLCQACCLVQEMGGIRHLHAHFAMEPCEVAWLVHCLTGVSFSVTTHAKDIYQSGRLMSPALQAQIGRARFIVANSRSSAAHLAASLNGHSSRIATVYNGVDLSSFARRDQQATEPLILSVGRLVEKKGFPDLLRACLLLRQRQIGFRCEIVGAGPLERRLRDLIQDYGLDRHVQLLGALHQERLLECYNRAAIFALPCTIAVDGDRDILPNVLKEAMAVGVPVVTTRLAGIEELIESDVSGFLTPPGDPSALAMTLEKLLADSDLRQHVAGNARRVIEQRFDRRTSFARLKDLLEDVLRDRSEEPTAAAFGSFQGKQCAH